MMTEKRELIQLRAMRLAPFLADYLTFTDSGNFEKGQAYRFTYLTLKGPRAFLQTFQYGELKLDRDSIQSVYWELRGEITGPGQLLPEEEEMIARHNAEVVDYEHRQQICHSERRPIGLLG